MEPFIGVNPANVGYLPAIVLKEIRAGRKCEITGGVCVTIDGEEEYTRRRIYLLGRFGEIVNRRSDHGAMIATRNPPPWAAEKIHQVIWDCPEMIRWDIPKEER
jgi:hypothetical protein